MGFATQQKNIGEIQLGLAESLGLKVNEETSTGRAHAIRYRLMVKKINIFVIDYVRQRLVLEEIGILYESGAIGFTITLTLCNMNVFTDMN
ncbi:hypothetical protein MIMGU_mgv1a025201mg, partial [Erythranthe guttata]